MRAVDLRDVVVLLGSFPALAGATLAVEPGEAVLVQGPNGAGKSTLLRLCAGLLRPERGSALVLGEDLAENRRAVRQRVGYVGHRSMLYDDLTVDENLRFWGRAAGIDEAQTRAAADRMQIDARLRDVAVANLSAGQRRRTALAVAAARRPELWLLDEPHAGLDRAEAVVDRSVTIAGGMAKEGGA